MLKIAKIAGGFAVLAREPAVEEEWNTLHPISAQEVIAELVSRGIGQFEIEEALTAAYPNWRTGL